MTANSRRKTTVEQGKIELEKYNAKNKQLKRQVEEMEEEMTRVNAKTRKYQREVEDLTEANDTLTKENQSLRVRLRRANEPGGKSHRTGTGGNNPTMNSTVRSGSTEWHRVNSFDGLNMTDGSTGSVESSVADETRTNSEADQNSLDGLS